VISSTSRASSRTDLAALGSLISGLQPSGFLASSLGPCPSLRPRGDNYDIFAVSFGVSVRVGRVRCGILGTDVGGEAWAGFRGGGGGGGGFLKFFFFLIRGGGGDILLVCAVGVGGVVWGWGGGGGGGGVLKGFFF